jgi:hypothetical protein
MVKYLFSLHISKSEISSNEVRYRKRTKEHAIRAVFDYNIVYVHIH